MTHGTMHGTTNDRTTGAQRGRHVDAHRCRRSATR